MQLTLFKIELYSSGIQIEFKAVSSKTGEESSMSKFIIQDFGQVAKSDGHNYGQRTANF
jgi:hypothetical protein